MTPKIRHRRVRLEVNSKAGRHSLVARAGEVLLRGGKRTLTLEAGERATLRRGAIGGPNMLIPEAAAAVNAFGPVRIFSHQRKSPVSFSWPKQSDTKMLVTVSRNKDIHNPLFSAVLERGELTIPDLRHGMTYWHVAPLSPEGKPQKPSRGRVLVLRDTSYRVLQRYQPVHKTVQETDGNTVIRYQLRLPGLTFRWKRVPGAASYRFKLFREAATHKPMMERRIQTTSLTLNPGRVPKGAFSWYAAPLNARGTIVRPVRGHRLELRYGNAAPDIQIITPQHGQTTNSSAVTVSGVTVLGSMLQINGKHAEQDSALRFRQEVLLAECSNIIRLLVADREERSAYALLAGSTQKVKTMPHTGHKHLGLCRTVKSHEIGCQY